MGSSEACLPRQEIAWGKSEVEEEIQTGWDKADIEVWSLDCFILVERGKKFNPRRCTPLAM